VRAAKGHDIDPRSLPYKTGDEYRAAARGRSTQLAVFMDSTGRAYSLPAHTLPSARGQGEPLSGRLDPPEGATFPGVLIGEPGERWVVASGAGYGFVVPLGELHSRNRAGKAVLKVPEGSSVLMPVPVPAGEEVLLATVNTDGRLLAFPVADLPELPRGKGNKIFGIPSKKAATGEESLVAIAAVAPGQTLRVLSGGRHMGLSYRELGDYRGERGQRGAVLPRGWRKVDGLEVEG
jgi:topoisomerase-4 subunit A